VKSKTKGIIVAAFFGIILLTSTITIGLSSSPMMNPEEKTTITGTPQDNFPDLLRPQYCESGSAKSNKYVTEYKIPTKCTMPLAITLDDAGNIWFAQTNTGNVAKFDPQTNKFTEYVNPEWPSMTRTMIWGMDSADGYIWYTDDAHDTIWKFSTADGKYETIGFPASEESLPQHLKVRGNHLMVNDFYGSKLSFLDLAKDNTYLNIPSPISGSFTGGFDVDSSGNIWYTNWLLRQGGALIKFDFNQFSDFTSIPDGTSALQFSDVFNLPPNLGTPVGLAIDSSDNIWIADTTSSALFKFNPLTKEFQRYITSDPDPSTYGNKTGIVKSPITGPYWVQFDGLNIVFNEQMGNAIAVLNPMTESMVEYHIPSKNPNWGDCRGTSDCGVAQVFGFKSTKDKVWFTQWVENNIGVVDLQVQLPITLEVGQTRINIPRGQSVPIDLIINSNGNHNVQIMSKSNAQFGDVSITHDVKNVQASGTRTVPIVIAASDSALSGEYKVLVSARADGVTVSQFITVNVTQ
jgi:virginiamycin B lyase